MTKFTCSQCYGLRLNCKKQNFPVSDFLSFPRHPHAEKQLTVILHSPCHYQSIVVDII
ncbi:hypothetical protein DW695_08795 [Bacteroides fragilis]|nr:hypothetical protein DW695_08795 [Bacteroides fragilis]HCW09700.1 hypothetical protein [Bacteroides fragilis]